MKKRLLIVLMMIGYYGALIGAVAMFGIKAGALMILACCCTALTVGYCDDSPDEPEHDSCKGCKHDLGGGQCRINLEAECGKGEHEAWEKRR